MTAEQWWAALLNGTVGAAVSFSGVLLVFWLTRRSDRKRIDDERAREIVATLSRKAMNLRKLEGGGAKEEEVVEEIMRELVLFHLRELGPHREAAEWAQLQVNNLQTLLTPEADFRAVRAYVAFVVAHMSSWATHKLPKKYFKDESFEVGPDWMPAEQRLDLSVTVTRAEMAEPTPEVKERVREALRRVPASE